MWVVGKLRWHEFEPVAEAPSFDDAGGAESWAMEHMRSHPELFAEGEYLTWRNEPAAAAG